MLQILAILMFGYIVITFDTSKMLLIGGHICGFMGYIYSLLTIKANKK